MMNEIKGKEFGYSCLFEKNDDIVKKFVNNKAKKEKLSRINPRDDVVLVPQLFWGDFDNPDIVILGKNPSYSEDDEKDNSNYQTFLKENLEFSKHKNNEEFTKHKNNKIMNFLSFNSEKEENFHAIEWWKKSFAGTNDFSNKKVAVFNLYGYYAKESSDVLFNKDMAYKTHIYLDNHIDDIKELINSENCKAVFILWSKCVNIWSALLGDCFNNNIGKIFVVNVKCPQNKLLKEAVPYSIYKQITETYFDDNLNKIENNNI